MMGFKIFMWISPLFFILHTSLSLRDVQMIIPEAAVRRSRTEMRCEYDLEKDVLYQVKWYRGDREFCRYSPRDVPPLKVFPIPGIEVNKNESDSNRLTIENVTAVAQGGYTCEVSADAPLFQTARVYGSMYVVDLPTSNPTLTLSRYYKPGMKLRAECISRESMPASNLSYFINNEPASTQHVRHRVDGELGGPMTAYSTIQFRVRRHHFKDGKMKIRCTAIIYSAYRMSTEKVVMEEKIPTTPAPSTRLRQVIHTVHRHRCISTSSNWAAQPWTTWIVLVIAISCFLLQI